MVDRIVRLMMIVLGMARNQMAAIIFIVLLVVERHTILFSQIFLLVLDGPHLSSAWAYQFGSSSCVRIGQ